MALPSSLVDTAWVGLAETEVEEHGAVVLVRRTAPGMDDLVSVVVVPRGPRFAVAGAADQPALLGAELERRLRSPSLEPSREFAGAVLSAAGSFNTGHALQAASGWFDAPPQSRAELAQLARILQCEERGDCAAVLLDETRLGRLNPYGVLLVLKALAVEGRGEEIARLALHFRPWPDGALRPWSELDPAGLAVEQGIATLERRVEYFGEAALPDDFGPRWGENAPTSAGRTHRNRIDYLLGDTDEVDRKTRALINQSPGDSRTLNSMAWLRILAGLDDATTLGAARTAVESGRGRLLDMALHTLALAEAEARMPLQALATLRRRMSASEAPLEQHDWYILGRAAEELGVLDFARVAYARDPPHLLYVAESTHRMAQERLSALRAGPSPRGTSPNRHRGPAAGLIRAALGAPGRVPGVVRRPAAQPITAIVADASIAPSFMRATVTTWRSMLARPMSSTTPSVANTVSGCPYSV